MRWSSFAWMVLPALASALLTWRARVYALSRGVIDMPNERSSHSQPTPRGGGLAIVVTVGVALLGFGATSAISLNSALALGLGGVAVAIVGYADDHRGLPVLPRIAVHVLAATIAVALFWFEAGMQPQLVASPTWILLCVLVFAIVWSINLFNFMDGIDGIAASQAVFVTSASAALIGSGSVPASGWVILLLASASASVGFLAWNWPPAKIFLGDVGSGFLGFWIAALAVGLHLTGVLDICTSIALNSTFIADATSTLLRRVVRGDRWHQAHRSHAYQILAVRWRSHLRVTLLLWVINGVLVLPAAYSTILWKNVAPWIAGGTILLLSLCCLGVGAGQQPVKER